MNRVHVISCRKLGVLLAAALPLFAQNTGTTPRQAHLPIRIFMGPNPNASTPTGYTPAEMQTAYGFNLIDNQGAGQTIALVDAYDDPNIEADLGVFDTQFGLPACTTANGCFTKIYASGTQPGGNADWALEMSLDVEWSHAIAPQAKIILIEAASQSDSALLAAVHVAVENGANVVSMSFGFDEFSTETTADKYFETSGVTFVASSGDSGHGVFYPAASPYVVSVGGTTLNLSSAGAWESETAWSCKSALACEVEGGSSGGQSAYETEPSYQDAVQSSGKRGVPDVAYDANPNTGVPIYDSGEGGWVQVGGTSMGSPEWAALFAIANSMRVADSKTTLTRPQKYLYAAAEADYHDITSGENGTCGALCTAGPGYDYVTGVGSPLANVLIPALVAAP
ncbi:MAG: S53 family peptidase [Bryobacteraceae bacterium]